MFFYKVVNYPSTCFTRSFLALSAHKSIKFTIKFKIFDVHYPHIPFCNFQNSVSEKMRCCLTFVCMYIRDRRERRLVSNINVSVDPINVSDHVLVTAQVKLSDPCDSSRHNQKEKDTRRVERTRGPGALYRAQEYHCSLVLFFFT